MIRKKGLTADLVLRLKYVSQSLRGWTGKTTIVPCDTPVILVSQIQRSGGTLLSQLFDDHPQLFVHPHEFHWGRPSKWDWAEFTDIPRRSAAYFWGFLHSSFIDKAVRRGYQKGEYSNTLPFVFDRLLQWRIFKSAVEDGVKTRRQVFDCYMTSFFNAWLDFQNLYRRPKKYTVAFTPRVNMFPEYVARFFEDYPEGFMISIVRDPLSWLASAKKHVRSQRDMRDKSTENLMEFWRDSTRAVIANRERHGERYLIVLFADLVERTDVVMRRLCEILGVPPDVALSTPTFNGIPIAANTSHEALRERSGVIASTLHVFRDVLTPAEIETIEVSFQETYDTAVSRSILHDAPCV